MGMNIIPCATIGLGGSPCYWDDFIVELKHASCIAYFVRIDSRVRGR